MKFKSRETPNLLAIWIHGEEILYEHIIEGTEDFNSNHCIGGGGCGIVYKAELPTRRVVAVKKLHSPQDEEMSDLKTIESEIQALTYIDIATLLSFMAFAHTQKPHFLFMSSSRREV